MAPSRNALPLQNHAEHVPHSLYSSQRLQPLVRNAALSPHLFFHKDPLFHPRRVRTAGRGLDLPEAPSRIVVRRGQNSTPVSAGVGKRNQRTSRDLGNWLCQPNQKARWAGSLNRLSPALLVSASSLTFQDCPRPSVSLAFRFQRVNFTPVAS